MSKKLINEATRMQQLAGVQINENKEITVDPQLYKQWEQDTEYYLVNINTNQEVGPMSRVAALQKFEELNPDEKETSMLVYKGSIDPFMN